MPRTDPPPRAYARQLLPVGCGYPLWTPEPGTQFVRYRRDGLKIGDVGVIVPENGSFDVFFNICLPREHPFHRVNGVPDNFTPIQLRDLDVQVVSHAETPGRVISTSSVRTLRRSQPSAETGPESAWNYEFSLSSSEGALLILPNGAESYTLLKKQLFDDVATQNGIEWYNFAEQRLGRIIRHDSLYLIDGVYKTRSWSVAAFHETSGSSGTRTEFPAHFKAEQVREGDISAAYTWETMRSLHWRVGPLDHLGIANQAVFISGFKIAVRDNILGKKWVEVEADVPPGLPRSTKSFTGSQGRSSGAKFWKRLLPKGGKGRGTADQAEDIPNSTTNPRAASSSIPNNPRSSRSVTVSHIPEAPQSVHPSDIVNRYLLTKDPNAIVSVTHDSQWSALLHKGLLKPEELQDEDRLESIVSENYRLFSRDGVVSLKHISDLSIRVIDIDDAACQAWKADKLMDAEEILSKQIIQAAGANHFLFANRALLRARLHHWDAALRDAETSIGIQSCVVAHIAKGFALFGLEKYGAAMQALSDAIRDCDAPDKDVALLVKAVILFETEYHAESMACIEDLLERCSTDFKSAIASVQAQMYVQLGTVALKNEDSERALQLLTKARSLGPFNENVDLGVISLITGWKFDNLQFKVCQQLCEGYYFAGHFKEAANSLEAMVQNLGEDVKTRKGNAEWLARFHQQCLKSLESLGDAAMWSQDFPEAITQYTAALNMNPNVRDGILVKRSKAHAGIRAWDDALNDANEAIELNPLGALGYERKYNALQGMERYDEATRAFSTMISNLEHFAEPPSQQPRAGNDNVSRTSTVLRMPQLRQRLDHNSIVESVLKVAHDPDASGAADILHTLRAERDEMMRGRTALVPVREPETPEEVNLSAEELPSVAALPSQHVRGQMTTEERDQKLREELTAFVRENPAQDEQVPELMKMVLRLADQAVVRSHRNDIVGESSVHELLEELQMHNAKQREILEALSDHWKTDDGSAQENANTRVPRTFRTLREDVSNILADEAQKIMGDVIKLGEERRRMQQELGQLMTMKSKYGPGGEFDPGWMPPRSMKPPKFPPPPETPPIPNKRPSGRSKKGTKPPVPTPTNQERALVTRPGWHTVAYVKPEPPPPIHLPERDVFGLFGPLTPHETTTKFLEAGPGWEPEAPFPHSKGDVKEASSLPSDSFQLSHELEDDFPILLSPPLSSSGKQIPSPQSPVRSFTPPPDFFKGYESHQTSPKVDPVPGRTDFIDTQHSPKGLFHTLSSYNGIDV